MKLEEVQVGDWIITEGMESPVKVVAVDMQGSLPKRGPTIGVRNSKGKFFSMDEHVLAHWHLAERGSKKSLHQRRVEQTMRSANQRVRQSPGVPSDEERLLRAKLILEEALETVSALGFDPIIVVPYPPSQQIKVTMEAVKFTPARDPDLVAIADGCADISVVVSGTLSSCGIADELLLEEVDESNIRKFDDGCILREDGKYLKPAGWVPPNIERVLDEQRLGSSDTGSVPPVS